MAFDAALRNPDPNRLLAAYEHAAASVGRLNDALFTSHEALLPVFEQALIRRDPESGRWFGGSAHLLWIGARTLFPESAHVELLRGLANPIGLKCGPDLVPDDLLRILAGSFHAGCWPHHAVVGWKRKDAAALAATATRRLASRPTGLWCCDPLHGTRSAADGVKRRAMARLEAEARASSI